MEFSTLLLTEKNNTAIITINRPEKYNALNSKVLDDLEAAFKYIESRPDLKGVIITGSGNKAFVAGADIGEIADLTYDHALHFSRTGQQLFAYIESFPRPVVAAVNGFALGGGCELAMACHMRVASENARFGQPEVKLGVIAGYGGTQRLPLLIGKGKAMELLLTGEQITAEQALELGLVNYIYTLAELQDKALELISKCYDKAPVALSLTIEAINAAFDTFKNGYDIEVMNFAKAVETEDMKEGTTAFIGKRSPVFKGK